MKVTLHNSNVYNIVGKVNIQLRNIEKKVTLVAIKLLRVLVSILREICPLGGGALKRFEAKLKKKQTLLTSIGNKNSIPAQKSFEDHISDWVNDSKVTGNKQKAAKRILDCYKKSKTTLDLGGLGLNSIPPKIGNLSNLIKLNLWMNKLEELPPEIGDLNKLEELVLSQNKLKELPPEIGDLSNLTKFDLSNNRFKKLPPWIGGLSNLTTLNLFHNQLEELPSKIGNLSNLTELNLSYNVLEELPSKIGDLSNLTELDLYHNQLEELPSKIGDLSNLTTLNLYHNQLEELPSKIGDLSNLTTLNLSGNNFKKLPSKIGNLSNLTTLNLSYNELEELPSEIGNLSNLEQLLLPSNFLEELPPEIGNLSKLKIFNFIDNKLEELPVELGQLHSLEMLYVYGNPNLSQLPLCMGNLVNLTYIETDETQILDSDRDSILNSCEKLRKAQAIDTLPDKIEVWLTASKKDIDLAEINRLESEQKGDLYEWLIRLERTKDFQKDQRALAKMVCEILKEMLENKEFKELFFSQIEANNESCQDRASMALNEIYTSMLLHRNQETKTLQDRLQLLVGCAKTLALRNAVSQVINDHQEEQGYVEGEAVQIYLYCETHLRGKLGLVTAIKSMTYTDIGKRDWVDQKKLIKTVNDTYLDFLVEIPAFEEVLKKEKEYQKMESEQTDELDDKIVELSMKAPKTHKESDEYLEWETEVNVLNNERKEMVNDVRKGWVKEKLAL